MTLHDEIDQVIGGIGEVPTLDALRDRGARRSRRRQRRLAVGAFVGVIGLAAGGVRWAASPDRDGNVVVAAPDQNNRAAWEDVATIDTPPTGDVRLLTTDDRVVVLATTGSVNEGSSTGAWELDGSSVQPLGRRDGALQASAAWAGRFAVVTSADEGGTFALSIWSDGGWVDGTLPGSEPRPSFDGMFGDGGWLYVLLRDPADTTPSPSGVEQLWRSRDGQAWEQTEPPTVIGHYTSELAAVPGGIARWTGGFSEDRALEAEIWSEADDRWSSLPVSPVDPMWARKVVWTGSTLVGCGAHNGPNRYDCLSWKPGATAWELLDPPPLPQSESYEGFGAGLHMNWDGARLVVGADNDSSAGRTVWYSYRPDEGEWRALPAPPPSLMSVLATATVDGWVYVAGVDSIPGSLIRVVRLRADDNGDPVPVASDLSAGVRVRVPDGFTASRSGDMSTVVVTDGESVPGSESGTTCPRLRVEFVEADDPADAFPWPGTAEMIPESTPPCTPQVTKVWGNGRQFTVRVYRSGATNPADARHLDTILGSFRAERSAT